MLHHTSAIILKKEDFRENDLLLTFYTRDFGKILAVSRGAKKIQSKLAGSLPVFCVIEIMAVRGRNFYQLASAEIFKDFVVLKQDLKKIYLASYFLELVNQLTKPEYKDQKIFNLLSDSFEILNQYDFTPLESPAIHGGVKYPEFTRGLKPPVNFLMEFTADKLNFLKNIFILKFLTELGYRPRLDQDFNERLSAKKIPGETLKLMGLMIDDNFQNLMKVKINEGLVSPLDKVINNFLKIHLDKPLNSEKFLTIDTI